MWLCKDEVGRVIWSYIVIEGIEGVEGESTFKIGVAIEDTRTSSDLDTNQNFRKEYKKISSLKLHVEIYIFYQ